MEHHRGGASPEHKRRQVSRHDGGGAHNTQHARDTLDDIRRLGIVIDHHTIKRVEHALTEAVSGHKFYVGGQKYQCKKERRQLRRFLYEAGGSVKTGNFAHPTYHSAFDYIPTTTFENHDITISRADGLSLTEDMVEVIKRRILDKMVMVRDSGEASKGRFAFLKSTFTEEDQLIITTKTEEARDWLLSINLGEVYGVELVIGKKQFAGLKLEASIFLDGYRDESPREVLDIIIDQNKHRKNINFSQWRMLDGIVKQKGTYIKLSIDAESAHNLLTNTLEYKTQTFKLRFP